MYSTFEQRKFVVPEIIIGLDSSHLITQYLKHFGARKTMIVTDKIVSEQAWFKTLLAVFERDQYAFVIFDDISSNPKDFEAMLGAELFLAEDCDCLVAIGGGSPIDCAKCISIVSTNGGHILDYIGVDEIRLPGPPLICVPTTAGTSADVSQFAIITDSQEHIKRAIISKKVVPDLTLIDPVPLMTMDLYLTACTGMDALTHAIEAYVSTAASPITDIHALAAIRIIKDHLIHAVKPNRNLDTMYQMMLASMHAGFAFSNASLGAVHAMAHSLGGVLDLPHGECNSILLEHLIDINFESAQTRYIDIAGAMGIEEAYTIDPFLVKSALVRKITTLRESIGIPSYVSLDFPNEATMTAMVVAAMSDPCMVTNPKELTYDEVKSIYGIIFKA